jgi:hypothetical protein
MNDFFKTVEAHRQAVINTRLAYRAWLRATPEEQAEEQQRVRRLRAAYEQVENERVNAARYDRERHDQFAREETAQAAFDIDYTDRACALTPGRKPRRKPIWLQEKRHGI